MSDFQYMACMTFVYSRSGITDGYRHQDCCPAARCCCREPCLAFMAEIQCSKFVAVRDADDDVGGATGSHRAG